MVHTFYTPNHEYAKKTEIACHEWALQPVTANTCGVMQLMSQQTYEYVHAYIRVCIYICICTCAYIYMRDICMMHIHVMWQLLLYRGSQKFTGLIQDAATVQVILIKGYQSF